MSGLASTASGLKPHVGCGEVEDRARALLRDRADRRVRGVALGVEDDHGAALALQVLVDRGDQVGGLALLDGAGHRGVLAAQVGVDRDRPEGVAQQPAIAAGAGDAGDAGAIGSAVRCSGTAEKPTDGNCHSTASSVEA